MHSKTVSFAQFTRFHRKGLIFNIQICRPGMIKPAKIRALKEPAEMRSLDCAMTTT